NVLASETVGLAVRDSSPAHVMALAADTLTKLRRRRRIRLDAIHATAVTLNARLDDAGRVLYSSVLPWQGVAPAPLLTDAVPHPVFIAGGQYRAVAEQRLGAGRGARSMLYFHVGDGVSARLVVRG